MKFAYRIGKQECLFSKLSLAKKSASKLFPAESKLEIWGLPIDWRKNKLMALPVLAAVRTPDGDWLNCNDQYFSAKKR